MIRIEQWPLVFRVFNGTITRAADPEPEPPVEGDPPLEDATRAKEEDDPSRRLYDVAISSEEPYERWFGIETLSHAKAAVDLELLRNKAPLLWNHNRDSMIGSVRSARIDDDKVLRGAVRFLRADPQAQIVRQGVDDEDITQISVGYEILRVKRTKAGDPEAGTKDEYVVTRWRPREVSVVTMAADQTVGFGRSAAADEKFTVEIEEDGDPAVEQEDAMSKVADPTPAVTPAPSSSSTPVVEVGAGKLYGEIFRLCAARGVADKAGDVAEACTTIQEAKAMIGDLLATKGTAQPSREKLEPPADIAKRYNYARAILMGAGEEKMGGPEAEWHQEILRVHGKGVRRNDGIMVPVSLRSSEDEQRRDEIHNARALAARAYPLDSATSNEGTEFKFTGPGEFIDMLRARTAVIRAGARTMTGLVGSVGFPRQTAAATASWVAESVSNSGGVSDSLAAFDLVTLAAKTLMATTGYTKQLLYQASVDVDGIVRGDLAAIMSRAIDRAAIHGTGAADDPTGIYAVSGVNLTDMGGTGTVPTFAKIVDMAGQVADDNADFGDQAYITTPLLAATLMRTLVASSAGSAMIWTGPFEQGQMAGYKAYATNQVSKVMADSATTGGSEHGIVFGNFAEMIIGFWNAMELVVDPYSLKKKGIIELTVFQLADLILRHASSFCKSHNAIP